MTIKKVPDWFKTYAKCVVPSSLIKGNEGMQQYSPIVFQDKKRKDSKGEKLDFPSTTKQLELKDVKQPEFPSTPFTGEAYAQSFHNPRPSNSVKDGTHVSIQGGKDTNYNLSPTSFRGEHGPDVQYKGSDYVPKKTKKSITIAGRKVCLIKGSEGSDNANLRDYPIDRGQDSSTFGANAESQKRKDFVDVAKMKEKVKAYDDAKKIHSYTPGNGPFQLAMDAKTAYLGRAKESIPFEHTKEYKGAKVTFGATPTNAPRGTKPKKVFVHLTEHGRNVKAKRTQKSGSIMKLILQYTQNQPLAAGFKPLLAHLVTNDDDDEENLKGPKLAKKAMSSADVYDRISSTRDKNKPISPKLAKLGSRAAKVAEDSGGTQAHDDAAPAHPGVDYKNLQPKSDRPNPIKGGKGDDLEYKDVDENELEAGIEVEQEHVKDSDDDEDEKRLKGADIAMDHLAEDEHYYTKLKEMERQGKEGAKSETKKEKLLKLGEATKSSEVVNLADYKKKKLEEKKGDYPRPFSVTRAEEERKKEKVGKSVIKERKLTGTVANAEKMLKIRQETNAGPGELKTTQGQLKAYTAKLAAERKKNQV